MLSQLRNTIRYIVALVLLLLFSFQPTWAQGPAAPSIFGNTLAIMLIILMIVLLIIIGILSHVLIGAADVKLKRTKASNAAIKAILLLIAIGPAGGAFAQGPAPLTTEPVTVAISGLSPTAFYVMASAIFVELLLIFLLLINIKFLLKKTEAQLADPVAGVVKVKRISWWDRINKFRPVSQDAELDLGHEYDGIRELNNKLPPWWLYGFYVTIIVAGIYLWRFHVSHTGPSSEDEYNTAVAKAEERIKEYLKAKGEAVDENSVTLLTAKADLEEGKIIFQKSCAACHLENGAGNVGPNLTDDFWMHGNDIKSVFKTIRYGINAMPPWQNAYSNSQLAKVASYVKSLRGTNPPGAKAPQGTEMKEEAPAKSIVDSLNSKADNLGQQ
jgi:cytochrome c oxidase cbb3-type subunit 3